MAKDQESICSQLIATAKSLEAQLTVMRAEHEQLRVEALALRRCLDRSGVLPADELEKELQSCSPKIACNEVSSTASCAISPPVVLAGLQAESRTCSLFPAEDTAATAVTSPTDSCRRLHHSPRRNMSAMQGGYPMSSSQSATTVTTNGIRAVSPFKGTRGRSPNKSCERMESLERQKSRARSRSSAKRHTAEDADAGEGGAEGDLYEVMSKLLDNSCSAAEQQRAVRSVQQILKRSSEPPNTWNGPGTPLSAVVRAGRPDLARLLLRARGNVNERDAKGVSALHVATYDGNAELCRVLLVARADVDACDRHGQTPLFFVPNREVTKLLIERRSDVTVLNRKGQSSLHLAGRAGLHEVLSWLTSRVSKSLADLRDVHGATALTYARQSGVPMTTSSPRASRGRRAASPRVPSRAASPQALQRVASPTSAGPLRGGGGSSQARTAAAERAAAAPEAPRAEQRRGSGQLPYVSELVEGRNAASAQGRHAAEVLEAAAAVATAAVATAAELEAVQQGAERNEEVRAFHHEADTWPVQAEVNDPVELGPLVGGPPPQPPEPVTRGPGAVAPGTQLPPEVDISEIGFVNETDEDLAELGVMVDDGLLAFAPPASQAPVADVEALAEPAPERAMGQAEVVGEDGREIEGAEGVEGGPGPPLLQGGVEDAAPPPSAALPPPAALPPSAAEDMGEPPEVMPNGNPPSKFLLRLEDELDEVF